MDIGIDLGTTYSVIAVKGRVKLNPNYPEGDYLEESGVTIIKTPDGDPTFPSVFWADSQDPTQILIGIEAKERAKDGEDPIMFSKRSIGTQEPLRLGNRSYTAKEVATHILRHLKQCAERALGEPVRRAVVTHPAYFDPNQVQETREAASEAGFDMTLPEQVMMEPAAAALAYTLSDNRDPLKVMTYDLGGGTFDVTVLERSEGVITIKAFDGDHLLGGYNFDRSLVQWLLNRIKESGRIIPYNDDNPDDRARRARLLQLAETVKFDLARARNEKVKVTIKANDILIDTSGKPVQIIQPITGQEYAALIQEDLDTTIRCCLRALDKAKMKPKELDQILLVGGSTYAPWVKKAVEAAFGTAVEPYNPDLCVAVGAALRAAELPAEAMCNGLKLVVEAPTSCVNPSCTVSGCITYEDGTELECNQAQELRVQLRIGSGKVLGPLKLNNQNRFIFEDIDLREDEDNQLQITIIDTRDTHSLPRLTKNLTVHHSTEGGGSIDICNVVPKPIYLKTSSGLKTIAEEGVPLPAKCEIKTTRIHSDSMVVVEVHQADTKIGEVRVENIPEDAGAGCQVIINVEITVKNEMRGEAVVLSKNGTTAAQCPVRVNFPPIPVLDITALYAEFSDLKARREQLEILSPDPDQRMNLAGKGKKLTRKIEKLLQEQQPDRQELQRALKELKELIEPPKNDMDPPRAHFRQLMENCHNMLASKPTDPQLQELRPILANIESNADKAFTSKNQRQWSQACTNLETLHEKIKKVTEGGNGGDNPPPEQKLPPTPILKDHFRADVDNTLREVENRREELRPRQDFWRLESRLNRIAQGLDKLNSDIDHVDDALDPQQALARLQLIMRPKPQLQKELQLVDLDVQ